jgi:hypothetical protein
MIVKEAIAKAKDYVWDLFSDDKIEHVALEEVEFDHHNNLWRITIGFSRPWEQTAGLLGRGAPRAYKLVEIDDETGQLRAVKNRDVPALT